MGQEERTDPTQEPVSFEEGEVLRIKGALFKVVLFDAVTDKICLELISRGDAPFIARDVQKAKGA